MEHLEHPDEATWNERREWFENLVEQYQGQGSYFVSDQACALIAEVQSCFCAGAWVSVIILAVTVIDAQLRETETGDYKSSTKDLLNQLGFGDEYQKLRERRNNLIHIKEDNPAITVDQQWENRDKLESEAESAVILMLKAFFSNPGT